MKPINVRKAKTHFSSLLERAHAGEEIILSKSGKPYARLVPLVPLKRRKPGLLKGRTPAEFFEPLSAAQLGAWE